MNSSRKSIFGCNEDIVLKHVINIPKNIDNQLYKCRVEYNEKICSIAFLAYKLRCIRSLQMVIDDNIEYSCKYSDRSPFERLKLNHTADEILIIKNGCITDTSFSNIVFFNGTDWITPANPLLKGTKREELLIKGVIIEKLLKPEQLYEFSKARLINAMLDLEYGEDIKIDNIYQPHANK